MGGSELGTNRRVPSGSDLYHIARNIETHQIQGLLIIGGWSGYESAYHLMQERKNYPAFNIPIVLLPASINNNLPGSDLSIGADTALNNIVEVVDKIKDSAVALKRAFIVEVMGRKCGYLALMGGLATGAERVYIHEEGVTLRDLMEDVEHLNMGFRGGKRLGLMIRNEHANDVYNTAFMCALFEEEGGGLYDVRQSILGYLQQGGNPSPFDRIQATRLATRCIDYLIAQAEQGSPASAFIGLQGREIKFHDLEDFPRMSDLENLRPKVQWWMDVREIAKVLAQPGPHTHIDG
jgi:6-phosphofructokinase 1